MLLTRLPLPIARAFDLHVLGLPPAFVLSQDQTLKLKDLILVLTWRLIQGNYCVTGTFTLDPTTLQLPEESLYLGDG